MKKNFLGWLAVGLMMFASAAFAAPTTPTADFTDNGDGTVTHKTTGLTALCDGDDMGWQHPELNPTRACPQ